MSDLRFVKIEDWTTHCLRLVARYVVKQHCGVGGVAVQVERNAIRPRARSTRMRRDKRRRTIDALLCEVADTFRLNNGRAPTAAVADAFDVRLQTAGDYVRRTRDRHYLGESIKRGKAGER